MFNDSKWQKKYARNVASEDSCSLPTPVRDKRNGMH